MTSLMTLDALGNGYFGNNYGNAFNTYNNLAMLSGTLANTNEPLFSSYDTLGGFNPMYSGYLGNMGMGFNPMIGMMTNPMMNMGLGAGLSNFDYHKLQALPIEQRQEYINDVQLRNQEIQMEQNDKLNDLNFDRNIRQQQYQNAYTTPQIAIKQAAQKLKFMIMDNRKDEIIPAFDAFMNLIAEQPQNKIRVKRGNQYVEERMDPEALRAKVREAYQQINGSDFLQDVDTELSGPFAQGLKRGSSFFLGGDKTDTSDIKAHVMGVKIDGGDKLARGVGTIIGLIPGVGQVLGGLAALFR